jgi:hypothetical protein
MEERELEHRVFRVISMGFLSSAILRSHARYPRRKPTPLETTLRPYPLAEGATPVWETTMCYYSTELGVQGGRALLLDNLL